MSIDAESDLFDSRRMAMVQNCLLNTTTLKNFTLKELYYNKVGEKKKNFMTTCTDICKPKNIRLKILDYDHNIILEVK